MLEDVFGNQTAEKVLISVYKHSYVHASYIAQEYGVSLNPIRQQLLRFERAGVLKSWGMGRVRAYSFNLESPLVEPIKKLLCVAYPRTKVKRV